MAEHIKTAAVIAMAQNRCIGKDNDLPWHIPEDLKLFKRLTMGKPIIMGRKTFQSILARLGKPLPGRKNIVVSQSGYHHEGATVFSDIETAISAAKQEATAQGLDEIIIGGGAQLYRLAMPYTDRIYLTEVQMTVEGDAFFPELPAESWTISSTEPHPATDKTPAWIFKVLERKT